MFLIEEVLLAFLCLPALLLCLLTPLCFLLTLLLLLLSCHKILLPLLQFLHKLTRLRDSRMLIFVQAGCGSLDLLDLRGDICGRAGRHFRERVHHRRELANTGEQFLPLLLRSLLLLRGSLLPLCAFLLLLLLLLLFLHLFLLVFVDDGPQRVAPPAGIGGLRSVLRG